MGGGKEVKKYLNQWDVVWGMCSPSRVDCSHGMKFINGIWSFVIVPHDREGMDGKDKIYLHDPDPEGNLVYLVHFDNEASKDSGNHKRPYYDDEKPIEKPEFMAAVEEKLGDTSPPDKLLEWDRNVTQGKSPRRLWNKRGY